MSYKCIEDFQIQLYYELYYEDDLIPTGESIIIQKGSVFELDTTNFIGFEVCLYNDELYFKISKNTFKEYFDEVK